jgi:hypothetical protein
MGGKKRLSFPASANSSVCVGLKQSKYDSWTVLLFKYSLAEVPREFSLEKEAQMVRH